MAEAAQERKLPVDDKIHTWPHLVRMEFLVALFVLIGLTIWSLTIDAPLEEPANPNVTMNPAKAPWYFLGLQEMLVYFDPWMAGVVMPTLIIIGLMAIPYIDANPLGNGYYTYKQRKFAIWSFWGGFLGLWVLMIVIGTFIRGPGWMWFWPTATWDAQRVEYTVNRNLDQLFMVDGSWLAHLMPAANRSYAPILARTIFGIFPTTLYFIVAGYACYLVMNATEFARKIFARMTLLQIVNHGLTIGGKRVAIDQLARLDRAQLRAQPQTEGEEAGQRIDHGFRARQGRRADGTADQPHNHIIGVARDQSAHHLARHHHAA